MKRSYKFTTEGFKAKEVKTSNFKVHQINDFGNIAEFIEINKQLGERWLNKPTRNKCQCCCKKWESFTDKNQSIYVAFTPNSMVICGDCRQQILHARTQLK